MWSGEATRNQGFAVETRVNINIGGDDVTETVAERISGSSTSTSNSIRKKNTKILWLFCYSMKSSQVKRKPCKSLKSNASSSDSSDDDNDIDNTKL
ncbi:hypothetical protein EVAR_74055_1, partial [Eumeta japonica]